MENGASSYLKKEENNICLLQAVDLMVLFVDDTTWNVSPHAHLLNIFMLFGWKQWSER